MAATTIATITMLKTTPNNTNKPILSSIKSLSPLTSLKTPKPITVGTVGTIAGAVFSTLSTCDAAFAVQQIADLAEGGDNRGLALLLPIVPAIAWVLFNILQPALNQINKMRSTKGVVIGLGLGLGGGLAAGSGLLVTPHASAAASEIAMVAAEAGSSDNRGQLLLFVLAPAIAWVLFNILQPALNQINKMRS